VKAREWVVFYVGLVAILVAPWIVGRMV